MIEYGITDEWNVQMRTSKHNCNHCVVTMETQWLPWQQLKDPKFLRNVVARIYLVIYLVIPRQVSKTD